MSHMTQDINQSWSLLTKWHIMRMIELINSIILSWWTWILRALPFIPLRNALPVLILIGGSLTEINDCADLWKYCWSKAHCFVAHWYGALCHRCEGLSIHQKSFWLCHLQWQGQEKITLRFTILKVASRMLECDNSTFTIHPFWCWWKLICWFADPDLNDKGATPNFGWSRYSVLRYNAQPLVMI